MPDVADREEVPAECRGRLLLGVVVAKPGPSSRREIDGAHLARRALAPLVVEDLDRDAGPRAADAAGLREPFVGWNDGSRPLGRAVELPHAPRREHVHDATL